MKALPPGLQVHLASGATTLAWCWRVTRNDGTAFGFTDHDRDLAFDGTTFEAATGFTAPTSFPRRAEGARGRRRESRSPGSVGVRISDYGSSTRETDA